MGESILCSYGLLSVVWLLIIDGVILTFYVLMRKFCIYQNW